MVWPGLAEVGQKMVRISTTSRKRSMMMTVASSVERLRNMLGLNLVTFSFCMM